MRVIVSLAFDNLGFSRILDSLNRLIWLIELEIDRLVSVFLPLMRVLVT